MAVATDDVDDVLGEPLLPVFSGKIDVIEAELGHGFFETVEVQFA